MEDYFTLEMAYNILLKEYQIIHITGDLDYKRIKTEREKLTKENKKYYQIFSKIYHDC